MNLRALGIPAIASVLALAASGCANAPGRPGGAATRPDQVLDFATLYGQNCAACHGDNGKNGAAISLNNPVYLSMAGADNLQRVAAAGVPGTLMPPFAKSQGGMLTDQQIGALVSGMEAAWAKPATVTGTALPPYAGSLSGDSARGQRAFAFYCARCHGADGSGAVVNLRHIGSLVDPAYLALVSNQGLRSILIAGQPEQGMPDWRSDANGPQAHPMSDQEITDIVAWLASHRTSTPGQPYPK